MNLIPLSDFKSVSQLSDSALVWLLCNNRLQCSCLDGQGIMVDIDSANNTAMLEAIVSNQREVAQEMNIELAEKIGSVLQAKFEELVDAAVQQLSRKSS